PNPRRQQMGRKTEQQQESATKKGGVTVTVDSQCPYCRGERKHSVTQRKACKQKGPIKNK
ncbi:MAG TPA: hypothetical protein VL500_05765, partial [Candidatus Eisenbacteria bacterium]|nr:hypothetical protein [Candidatus Eisenbacteria bacterium]